MNQMKPVLLFKFSVKNTVLYIMEVGISKIMYTFDKEKKKIQPVFKNLPKKSVNYLIPLNFSTFSNIIYNPPILKP